MPFFCLKFWALDLDFPLDCFLEIPAVERSTRIEGRCCIEVVSARGIDVMDLST